MGAIKILSFLKSLQLQVNQGMNMKTILKCIGKCSPLILKIKFCFFFMTFLKKKTNHSAIIDFYFINLLKMAR